MPNIASTNNDSAISGQSVELQNCHEAYQVLVKVIRTDNSFARKAMEKKEKQIQIMGHVEKVSSVWMRRGLVD